MELPLSFRLSNPIIAHRLSKAVSADEFAFDLNYVTIAELVQPTEFECFVAENFQALGNLKGPAATESRHHSARRVECARQLAGYSGDHFNFDDHVRAYACDYIDRYANKNSDEARVLVAMHAATEFVHNFRHYLEHQSNVKLLRGESQSIPKEQAYHLEYGFTLHPVSRKYNLPPLSEKIQSRIFDLAKNAYQRLRPFFQDDYPEDDAQQDLNYLLGIRPVFAGSLPFNVAFIDDQELARRLWLFVHLMYLRALEVRVTRLYRTHPTAERELPLADFQTAINHQRRTLNPVHELHPSWSDRPGNHIYSLDDFEWQTAHALYPILKRLALCTGERLTVPGPLEVALVARLDDELRNCLVKFENQVVFDCKVGLFQDAMKVFGADWSDKARITDWLRERVMRKRSHPGIPDIDLVPHCFIESYLSQIRSSKFAEWYDLKARREFLEKSLEFHPLEFRERCVQRLLPLLYREIPIHEVLQRVDEQIKSLDNVPFDDPYKKEALIEKLTTQREGILTDYLAAGGVL